ncbi:alginate biosynthesis protein [Loktanella sp. D2R18]|uniref:alginate O-acetyltransferase AlgX-related protein n=1 Tax=Rhodobacterales TaxID=204455 RepID=UPI000DE99FF2|nr:MULTISPECIES: alginate biosynthesis protein [Rhodobacterales]MDO6591926.1 hypothetical protein [Yoonia sp. 1_MG-2023]RBW42642.1 alginate biosynthesis protein [Loktanella sp. D2R18]
MIRFEPHLASIPCSTVLAIALISPDSAYAESNFGCSGLEIDNEIPSLEGKDGVFFRINTDIRMNHPFSDHSVAYVAELSRTLAAQGTTLVYVPIPTKSVTMPDHLPPEAALYGFDLDLAIAVHDDVLNRLNAAGVMTVDAREAMLKTSDGELPFFKADFHWSAAGARETARAIADVITAHPTYEELETTAFETMPLEVDIAFSGMRRDLQEHCLDTLPEAETMTYQTMQVESLDLAGGDLDLFGDEDSSIPIALLGTSFSDSEINNFPGFLAQYSSLEVVDYALTGGNQFGAMISYLTSTEFHENPPRFLVWENPIYTNLAQYGDQPMRELIAAAGPNCTIPLAPQMNADDTAFRVDLTSLAFGPEDTLFVDLNQSAGTRVEFSFVSDEGLTRRKIIERGERLTRTGRFYMPLSGLWPNGAVTVDISTLGEFYTEPSVFICTTKTKEEI